MLSVAIDARVDDFPPPRTHLSLALHLKCCNWNQWSFSWTEQNFHYRPQHSCGKVMFLHLSVILFTEGGFWQTPPQADTPWTETASGRHPQTDTPQGRQPPGRHPPGQTPLLRWPLQWTLRILLESILAEFSEFSEFRDYDKSLKHKFYSI